VFVDFSDRRSAVIARKLSMKGTAKVFDKVITNADWARVLDRPPEEEEVNTDTIKKLFIRGLEESVRQEHIYLAFITYGEVELIKKQADYAFVHFVRREDAKKALENPPKEINGQTNFTVRYALPRKKKFNNFNQLNERSRNKGNMERYIPPGYSDPDPNWIEPGEYQRRKKEGTLPSHHYNKDRRADKRYEQDFYAQYGHKNSYRGPREDPALLSKGKDKRRRRSDSGDEESIQQQFQWSTGKVTHGNYSHIPITPHTVKGSANFEVNLADELLEKKKKDILSFFDIKEVREPEKVRKKREGEERRERNHSSSKKRRHSSRESRSESHSSRSESRSESRDERAKYKLPIQHDSQRQKYHMMQKLAKRKVKVPALYPATYPNSQQDFDTGYSFKDNISQRFTGHNNPQSNPPKKPTALLATPTYNPAAALYDPRAPQTYNQNPNNTDNYNRQPSRPILPLPTLDYQNISPPHHDRYSPTLDDFNPNDFEFEDYDEHNRPVQNNYNQQQNQNHSSTEHRQYQSHQQNYDNQNNQYHNEHVKPSYDPGTYVDPNKFYRLDGGIKSNLSNLSGAKWNSGPFK